MAKAILKVKNLNVEFDGHKVLDDISFVVDKNDTLAIIGPNGAGKTVLFKCLLGLLPYDGKVEWDKNMKVGYVPQKLYVDNDLPLTVGEFLGFREKDARKAIEVLKQVGFSSDELEKDGSGQLLQSKRLGVLSGGELQRVLIAFALIGNPNVLLLDEPTSGVDVSAEETVYTLTDRLKKESGLTVIFISHELGIVYKHATSVLCLNKEKICFGPPSEAIDEEKLKELYGESVNFHYHEEVH
ncbi:metal ABC transporter ATP-binding protein [candidate division WWE3 bacterium]|uniref:Metal ABC transporter ATP-binding protein n=1 Tax=candidate division WWE3 bacterium TaxID=2053526 RepID=A0A955LJK6_UNCKA|nr:metal ABC transporter ATP-binding protein [candidate division WWE3 bacterium]